MVMWSALLVVVMIELPFVDSSRLQSHLLSFVVVVLLAAQLSYFFLLCVCGLAVCLSLEG